MDISFEHEEIGMMRNYRVIAVKTAPLHAKYEDNAALNNLSRSLFDIPERSTG